MVITFLLIWNSNEINSLTQINMAKTIKPRMDGVDRQIPRYDATVRRGTRESAMNAKVYRSKPSVKSTPDAAGVRMSVAKRNIKPVIMKRISKSTVKSNPRKYLTVS